MAVPLRHSQRFVAEDGGDRLNIDAAHRSVARPGVAIMPDPA
jgi:hypothetical protein